MAAHGLAKLIEECGELVQVAGKRLAYFTTEDHPDGGPALSERLEDEIADVQAACQLVTDQHGLRKARIDARTAAKHGLFKAWVADPHNNKEGVQYGMPPGGLPSDAPTAEQIVKAHLQAAYAYARLVGSVAGREDTKAAKASLSMMTTELFFQTKELAEQWDARLEAATKRAEAAEAKLALLEINEKENTK
jgi:NTP pyrophosphatase (non-canonical NTP hydrolase)